MKAKARKKHSNTVPITTRALLQRINRVLAKNNRTLRATRGAQMRSDAGDFFVLDLSRNEILTKDVDPQVLGRELGVLKEYEYLSQG
jgi:hypothetical protein